MPAYASSTRSSWPRRARPTRAPTRWSAGWPGSGALGTTCRPAWRSRRRLPRRPVRPCATGVVRVGGTSRWARCSSRPGMLPDRAAELAYEAGAIAVSAPLGAHDELARVILARYSVGALQLVDIPA